MRILTRTLAIMMVSAACPLTADASGQSEWQQFWAEYPYHIQTLALGAAGSGGRTLVVAEPRHGRSETRDAAN